VVKDVKDRKKKLAIAREGIGDSRKVGGPVGQRSEEKEGNYSEKKEKVKKQMVDS